MKLEVVSDVKPGGVINKKLFKGYHRATASMLFN